MAAIYGRRSPASSVFHTIRGVLHSSRIKRFHSHSNSSVFRDRPSAFQEFPDEIENSCNSAEFYDSIVAADPEHFAKPPGVANKFKLVNEGGDHQQRANTCGKRCRRQQRFLVPMRPKWAFQAKTARKKEGFASAIHRKRYQKHIRHQREHLGTTAGRRRRTEAPMSTLFALSCFVDKERSDHCTL